MTSKESLQPMFERVVSSLKGRTLRELEYLRGRVINKYEKIHHRNDYLLNRDKWGPVLDQVIVCNAALVLEMHIRRDEEQIEMEKREKVNV